MAVRWRQGHQETPVVSGAQTLLSTDTKEESGSQTPGTAEEHDKASGLGTRASTQDPNLSWSANGQVTNHPHCLALRCFLGPWASSAREIETIWSP